MPVHVAEGRAAVPDHGSDLLDCQIILWAGDGIEEITLHQLCEHGRQNESIQLSNRVSGSHMSACKSDP
eukprot:SAG31_NODE_653_length_13152_cov_4.899487_7_plen_69_part_00